MAMEELSLRPEELRNVRVATYLDKRNHAFPYAWRQRYAVVSGNFLFIYLSPREMKPTRVVCIDEAIAEPSSKHASRARPHAFTVVSRSGKKFIFAAETREERDKWLACVTNAGYAPMYGRTREAVRFLERCKDAVASYMALGKGVAVPPPSSLPSSAALMGAGSAAGSAGADGDGTIVSTLPPTSAASQPPGPPPPVASDPRYAPFMALRAGLSGSEILEALVTMRGDATEARAGAARVRELNEALAKQVESTSAALEQALAKLAAVSDASATSASSSAGWARERDELRRQVDGLTLSNINMADRVNELTRELAAAGGVGGAAAAALGGVSGGGDAAGGVIRARIRDLEGALAPSSSGNNLSGGSSAVASPPRAAAHAPPATPTAGSGTGLFLSLFNRAKSDPNASAKGEQQPPQPPPPPQQQPLSSGSSSAGSGAAGSAGGGVSSPAAAGGLRSASQSQQSLSAAPASSASSSTSGGGRRAGGGGASSSSDPAAAYEHEWAPFLAEGQRLEAQDKLSESEQAYRSVLDAKVERCGRDAPTVAGAHRDLGRVLSLQGKHALAEAEYACCVRVCSGSLGEAHPSTACALTDLAAVLREQGKFAAAEGFAKRAVESLRAGVGPDDVSTATAAYNLAGLAKRQSKWGDAEEAYAEALGIFRARLGEGAGETADTLYQLGCLYRKRGDHRRAGRYFGQAADSYAAAYGPDDKRVGEAAKRARAMSDKAAAGGVDGDSGGEQAGGASNARR